MAKHIRLTAGGGNEHAGATAVSTGPAPAPAASPFPPGTVHPGWPQQFWETFYHLPPLPDDFEEDIWESRALADSESARRAAWIDAEFAHTSDADDSPSHADAAGLDSAPGSA